jgi:hypothetical protein
VGAPVQNPNDGTALGTSEVIADEYIDPILGCRVVNALPPTPYKLPRSKIAVGQYGQDWGDAAVETPLHTESTVERWYAEKQFLLNQATGMSVLKSYQQETVTLCDARGSFMANRGVR